MELNNIRSPSAILKMIEIMLLIIIMACFFSQFYGWGLFVSSVFVGCFLQAIVFLANLLMGYDQIQKTPLELMFYSYSVITLFASAICLFTTGWGPWIAAGVFSLMLSGVYCGDLYFAFVNLTGGPPSFLSGGQQHLGPQQPNPQDNPAFPTGFAFQPGQATASAAPPPAPDSVDQGNLNKSDIFQTNPVYPDTMNYPPSTYFGESPPEYPVNIPTQPKP